MMLNGATLGQVDDAGEPITDDTFLVMLNSSGDSVTYTLPQSPRNRGWRLLLNTYDLDDPFGERLLDGTLEVAGRSVVVLRELAEEEAKSFNSEHEELPVEEQKQPAPPAEEEAEEPVPAG